MVSIVVSLLVFDKDEQRVLIVDEGGKLGLPGGPMIHGSSVSSCVSHWGAHHLAVPVAHDCCQLITVINTLEFLPSHLMHLIFLCRAPEGVLEELPSASSCVWHNIDDLPERVSTVVPRAIAAYRAGGKALLGDEQPVTLSKLPSHVWHAIFRKAANLRAIRLVCKQWSVYCGQAVLKLRHPLPASREKLQVLFKAFPCVRSVIIGSKGILSLNRSSEQRKLDEEKLSEGAMKCLEGLCDLQIGTIRDVHFNTTVNEHMMNTLFQLAPCLESIHLPTLNGAELLSLFSQTLKKVTWQPLSFSKVSPINILTQLPHLEVAKTIGFLSVTGPVKDPADVTKLLTGCPKLRCYELIAWNNASLAIAQGLGIRLKKVKFSHSSFYSLSGHNSSKMDGSSLSLLMEFPLESMEGPQPEATEAEYTEFARRLSPTLKNVCIKGFCKENFIVTICEIVPTLTHLDFYCMNKMNEIVERCAPYWTHLVSLKLGNRIGNSISSAVLSEKTLTFLGTHCKSLRLFETCMSLDSPSGLRYLLENTKITSCKYQTLGWRDGSSDPGFLPVKREFVNRVDFGGGRGIAHNKYLIASAHNDL